MRNIIIPLLLGLLAAGCREESTSPAARSFNIELKYGVDARNELNTYDNILTKDLVRDGTVTVPFTLPDSDITHIRNMLLSIDFFSYPDTLRTGTPGSAAGQTEPHATYFFRVTDRDRTKTLFWDDVDPGRDTDANAVRLKEAIASIVSIVDSNPTYRELPPAKEEQ